MDYYFRMKKDNKKEPNRNNNQLIAANDLDTTKRLLEIYLKEKSIVKMNKQSVLIFFNKWVKKRNKSKTIRPYRLRNMLYQCLLKWDQKHSVKLH